VGSVIALVTVVTMQTYKLVYNGPGVAKSSGGVQAAMAQYGSH
jgi:hypothetical protein